MQPTEQQQLLDMAAVHAFNTALLEEVLGHPVPVPEEVALATAGGAAEQCVAVLARWLNLLDLAIAPPMVRDALKDSTTRQTAEALLRHFVRKSSHSEIDRDKSDLVVTFLYRALVPADQQIQLSINVDRSSPFEEEIYAMVGADQTSRLPDEHRQLVREFPFIREEVDDYDHFDQLVDSGVIQRVRDIKQRFGESFYHPRVLAISAAYNVYFHRRFDQLFRATAQQIKTFAAAVQQQGGSVMSRVDGDITVLHLTEVEQQQSEILQTEYGRAQEQFRKISKLKKAVDSRTGAHRDAAARSAAAQSTMNVVSAARAVHAATIGENVPSLNTANERVKLRGMEASIRNFIIAADPKSANVVPLRSGNIVLSNAEVDAFRADHAGEKSFRSDLASALRQAVSIQACIQLELNEFSSKAKSAYLWKPHADALAFLISSAQSVQEQCGVVVTVAQQRGLEDKVNAIRAALQKLHQQVQVAARALQGNSP